MRFFWHNPVMNAFETGLVKLTNYIWLKRRNSYSTAKKISSSEIRKRAVKK